MNTAQKTVRIILNQQASGTDDRTWVEATMNDLSHFVGWVSPVELTQMNQQQADANWSRQLV